MLNKIRLLEEKGLPLPIEQCQYCKKTIYRDDNWYQCPDCGTRTTANGGYFPPIEGYSGVSIEFKNKCEQSKLILNTV